MIIPGAFGFTDILVGWLSHERLELVVLKRPPSESHGDDCRSLEVQIEG